MARIKGKKVKEVKIKAKKFKEVKIKAKKVKKVKIKAKKVKLTNKKNDCDCDDCKFVKNCQKCVYCLDRADHLGKRRWKQKCFYRKCTGKYTNRKRYSIERKIVLAPEVAEGILEEMEEQKRVGRLLEVPAITPKIEPEGGEDLDEPTEAVEEVVEEDLDEPTEEVEEEGANESAEAIEEVEEDSMEESLITEQKIKKERIREASYQVQEKCQRIIGKLGKAYFRKLNRKIWVKKIIQELLSKYPPKNIKPWRSNGYERQQLKGAINRTEDKAKTGVYIKDFIIKTLPDPIDMVRPNTYKISFMEVEVNKNQRRARRYL